VFVAESAPLMPTQQARDRAPIRSGHCERKGKAAALWAESEA